MAWEFVSGVAATGATTLLGWMTLRGRRRESIEERLQRWQTETVKRVTTENDALRDELGPLKTVAARLVIVESCVRLLVAELMRLDPKNSVLSQVGAMLIKAIPVDTRTPDDMRDLLAEISAAEARIR